jgi:hypothetical protein
LWLAATTVVAASLNKSAVVTDHMVNNPVVDICSLVGGFLELSVSKDDDLIYDFKCGRHFLKTILKPQKTLKSNLEHFFHFVRPKILAHPR